MLVLTNDCGHELCTNCLDRAITLEHECPNVTTPIRQAVAEVDQLEVRCPNLSSGCEDSEVLDELGTDLAACHSEQMPCDHVAFGCPYAGPRLDHAEHLQTCAYEKVKGLLALVKEMQAENTMLRQSQQVAARNCRELTRHLVRAKERQECWRQIMATRAKRLRRLHCPQLQDSPQPPIHLYVKLWGRDQRPVLFNLKPSTKLEKMRKVYEQKENEKRKEEAWPSRSIMLTADGPLRYGGYLVSEEDTSISLGLQEGDSLFAEAVEEQYACSEESDDDAPITIE